MPFPPICCNALYYSPKRKTAQEAWSGLWFPPLQQTQKAGALAPAFLNFIKISIYTDLPISIHAVLLVGELIGLLEFHAIVILDLAGSLRAAVVMDGVRNVHSDERSENDHSGHGLFSFFLFDVGKIVIWFTGRPQTFNRPFVGFIISFAYQKRTSFLMTDRFHAALFTLAKPVHPLLVKPNFAI